jgi:hypothetical protein
VVGDDPHLYDLRSEASTQRRYFTIDSRGAIGESGAWFGAWYIS